MLLFLISFIAGVLTVLAPCVLPLLPVIVGGSLAGDPSADGWQRAYRICIALGGSVIAFTLLLKASTALINVPQSFWELFSGLIISIFGLILIFPRLWDSLGIVNLMNRSSNRALAVGYQQNSIWGDMLMGAALGPVFSSCSPTYFVILATVLPASFAVGFLDLLAYAVGLSGFLFIIAIAGQRLVDKLGISINPEGWFRRGIGILFLVVGLAVATGTEANVEVWLLNNGFDVTMIEQHLLQSNEPPKLECNGQECLGASTSSTATSTSNVTSTTFLSPALKAGQFPKAPELTGIDGYINTNGQPITIGQFKGKKVVLIDIWTYSCINCQRTLPYVKAWYDTYASQGLEIIGVHTPEFAFEHVLQNVQMAVDKEGIKYPVVLDNEYKTWNAFGNQYWPRKYLIDIDGYIVYDHAGEGDYAATETAIRKALAERNVRLGIASSSVPASAPKNIVAVDNSQLGSPETYFGAARNEFLGNGQQATVGVQTLAIPASLQPNMLYLGGTWNFASEYASNQSFGAQISFEYKAKNVYFVAAGPSADGVKVKVTRDGGKPLGSARGADVDANGEVTISGNRLYSLINDSDYGVHTIEITIEGAGLQAYTFTFG